MWVWRGCVIRGLGSRSMELGLLLGNVLRLLGLLLLNVLGSRSLDVLRLLRGRSLDVLGLLGSHTDVTALSLERGIVPAGIVLTILVVLVVQAGSNRGGGEVLRLLLLLRLLHVTRSGRGRSVMGSGSRSDWQMVSGGAESEINSRR